MYEEVTPLIHFLALCHLPSAYMVFHKLTDIFSVHFHININCGNDLFQVLSFETLRTNLNDIA